MVMRGKMVPLVFLLQDLLGLKALKVYLVLRVKMLMVMFLQVVLV
jgi:hypothetical protein